MEKPWWQMQPDEYEVYLKQQDVSFSAWKKNWKEHNKACRTTFDKISMILSTIEGSLWFVMIVLYFVLAVLIFKDL